MTPLRLVLTYFENTRQGISLNTIARDMNISPGQVQNMVDFWVRKGRLKLGSGEETECGNCDMGDGCPFIVDLPRTYELVQDPQ